MTAKPTIGRSVLFRLADGDAPDAPRMHPAIVTRVWSDTCVNLTVFRDGGAIQPAVSVNHAPVDGRTTPTGTWSWPVIHTLAAQNVLALGEDTGKAPPPAPNRLLLPLEAPAPVVPAIIEHPAELVAAPTVAKAEAPEG